MASLVVLLIGMVVRVLSVTTTSLVDADVALGALDAFVSGRVVRLLLVGAPDASGIVDGLGMPRIEDATGVVDRVGVPRMETVPDKSIVEAAFASALAVRGRPKTLQMLAMAPKVAIRSELVCTQACLLVDH